MFQANNDDIDDDEMDELLDEINNAYDDARDEAERQSRNALKIQKEIMLAYKSLETAQIAARMAADIAFKEAELLRIKALKNKNKKIYNDDEKIDNTDKIDKIDHNIHGTGCHKHGKPHINDDIFVFDDKYFNENNINLNNINKFELLHYNNIDISSQGSYNACVAYASSYCIEYAELRKNKNYKKASSMFIWYNARKLMSEHDKGFDSIKDLTLSNVGVYNRFGFIVCERPEKQLNKHHYGIVTDNIYKPNSYNDKPSDKVYEIAKQWSIDKCIYIEQNEHHIKQVLIKFHHPIIFGLHLYDGFRNNVNNINGIIPLPTYYDKPNENDGHCIVIVGFKTINNIKYFKIRNSWGKQWGKNGYAYIQCKFVCDKNWCYDFYCCYNQLIDGQIEENALYAIDETKIDDDSDDISQGCGASDIQVIVTGYGSADRQGFYTMTNSTLSLKGKKNNGNWSTNSQSFDLNSNVFGARRSASTASLTTSSSGGFMNNVNGNCGAKNLKVNPNTKWFKCKLAKSTGTSYVWATKKLTAAFTVNNGTISGP